MRAASRASLFISVVSINCVVYRWFSAVPFVPCSSAFDRTHMNRLDTQMRPKYLSHLAPMERTIFLSSHDSYCIVTTRLFRTLVGVHHSARMYLYLAVVSV